MWQTNNEKDAHQIFIKSTFLQFVCITYRLRTMTGSQPFLNEQAEFLLEKTKKENKSLWPSTKSNKKGQTLKTDTKINYFHTV